MSAAEEPDISVMLCDNCGEVRRGRYCGRCGQNDRSYRRALVAVVGEALKETFELDSRLLRSLKTLFVKPGELSSEFSRNRRADYVSPIRLYLFASLAFFFVLSLTTELTPTTERAQHIELPDVSASDREIQVLAAALTDRQRSRMREILQRADAPLAAFGVTELAKAVADDPAPPGMVGRYLLGVVVDALYDPARTVDRLLDKLPVAMFVLLPLYAGILALVYRRRERYYVEHLVFAVHVHTITFLVCTVLLLFPGSEERSLLGTTVAVVEDALLVSLVVYQYLALKRYYGGSHLGTAARQVALLALYVVLLLPGLLAGAFVVLGTA